jgi:hypothetical protein
MFDKCIVEDAGIVNRTQVELDLSGRTLAGSSPFSLIATV